MQARYLQYTVICFLFWFFFSGPLSYSVQLTHGFYSPWPVAFLCLPTLGLSAPHMCLCRPEKYLETCIFRACTPGSVPIFFFSILFILQLFYKGFLNFILFNQSCKIFLFLSLDVSLVFKCWQVCKYLEVLGTFIKKTQRNYYISSGRDPRAKSCHL